jgi:acetyltransferase-like isoleucine patch superfamily enzyme
VSGLSRKLYQLAYGDRLPPDGAGQALDLGALELAGFLWRKGGMSRLRGILRGWRLGGCGGRLFVGKGVRIDFPRRLSVGRGAYLADNVYVNALSKKGFRLGDNVRVREGTWMLATGVLTDPGEGLSIGDNVYIGPYCVLGAGGGLSIGSDVTIGAHVDILAEDHEFGDASRPINRQGVTRKGIAIGDDCWIGNRATILDGVKVGRGCAIGAAAVVTRDLPEFSVAVGSPARVIRDRRTAGTTGGPPTL